MFLEKAVFIINLNSLNVNRTMSTFAKMTLTLNSINQNVVRMNNVVRGSLEVRATEIEKELKRGVKKPFDRTIRANIGDGQAMKQPYITYMRHVLALLVDPTNFNNSKYPDDAKRHAQTLLNDCGGGSIGSYSDAKGIDIIRHHVAEYIQKRDGGVPAQWQDIYLSSGASQSIKAVMSLLNKSIDGKVAGIMAPIPQYPLYTATISELGMEQIDYYLDEDNNWALSIPELEQALTKAKEKCFPRAVAVINPGNPTGQVLTRQNIVDIIRFAHKHNLLILADEVYQDNVYESEFHSFKKILFELGEPYKSMQLASFMSCSKGYMGECGLRGGYCELINLDPEVRIMFEKFISAQLCSPTVGQCAVDILVNPPKKGDPSHEQWLREKTAILESLKHRAELVASKLNSIEGFFCNPVQGAMYGFARFEIPPKAIEVAEKKGMPADLFYLFELLEETGICIAAGSAFGQKPGTYHLRTTILPPIETIEDMMNKLGKFHQHFLAKYK